MIRIDDGALTNGEWECMECGYIEDGVKARRPKKCPECGAPAEAFDFFSDEGLDEGDWNSEALAGNENDEDFEDEDRY